MTEANAPLTGPEYLFYHLEREGHDLRLHDLLALVVSRQWRARVHGRELARMKALDAALWAARPESFLPHALADGARDDLQPILLSAEDGPAPKDQARRDVFVSLHGADLPQDVAGFQRIILFFEAGNAEALAAARAQFRRARDQGRRTRYFRENETGKWEEQGAKPQAG